MNEWLVYVLIDAKNQPFYIGATCKPKRRLKEHRATFGKHIELKVLEPGFNSPTECGEAERRHIADFRSRGIDIKNVSNGGFVGNVHRDSTRAKLSRIVTGRKVTWGDKIAAATKGRPHDWTPEGREASARTQFCKGVARPDEDKRKENQRAYLKSLSFEQRSKSSATANKKWWASASPEQKAERVKKMTAGRDPSKISKWMKVAASKRLANPEARRAFGDRIKNFWANMTPDQKDEYVKRRGLAIAQAKAAKRI